MEKILQRTAAFGVAHGSDDFGRLVDDDVDAFGLAANQPAGNFNVVTRQIGLRAKFGDGATVYRNEAGSHHFFGTTPRGEARAGDNFLETLFHVVGC